METIGAQLFCSSEFQTSATIFFSLNFKHSLIFINGLLRVMGLVEKCPGLPNITLILLLLQNGYFSHLALVCSEVPSLQIFFGLLLPILLLPIPSFLPIWRLTNLGPWLYQMSPPMKLTR